jgi:hypothetical protein
MASSDQTPGAAQGAPSHSAAAAALGYLHQAEVALLELSRRSRVEPKVAMSLEMFDDVAFENDGKPIELLQVKHHVTGSKSISDASPDLWSTMEAWIDTLAVLAADDPTPALVLMTTASAPQISAAAALRSADRDVPTAMERLQRTAIASDSQANARGYELYLALATGERLRLVESIVVADGAASIVDVREQLGLELRQHAAADHRHHFVTRLLDGGTDAWSNIFSIAP